jgi:hypothetical protein
MKVRQTALAVARALGESAHLWYLRYATRAGLFVPLLPLQVDKIEDVPEAARGAYVQKDGKYVLDAEIPQPEDVGGLRSALQKERDAAAAARRESAALVKKYEGIDPETVRAILARFENDEDAALIKAGKFDEVIRKKTERMQQEHVRELEKERANTAAEVERRKKYERRVLESHLMAAAAKAGVIATAMDDVVARGASIFALDENGDPVHYLDEKKTIELGKDGKTPYRPEEWLSSTMKDKAPHWFPSPGAGGGTGANGSRPAMGGKQMKRVDFDAIADPVQKREAAKTYAIVD